MQSAYSKRQKDRLRLSEDRHRPLGRTIRQTLAEICRQTIIFLFNQVGVGCLLLGYTVSGAFVFRHTEAEYDRQLTAHVEMHRETTARDLWELTRQMNQFNVTEPDWWRLVTNLTAEYQQDVIEFVRRGYLGGSSDQSIWTVPSSIIYCISIYSTIGYGYLTPHTTWGKICTIIYAIVGIPLMLLYMSNVGAVLANCFKFVYFKMLRRRRRAQLRSDYLAFTSGGAASVSVEECLASLARRPEPTTVPITGCVLVMTGYVLAGGVLFGRWEGWSFLDGCWFCFISLVSVGFGDLVPGFSVRDTDSTSVDVKLSLCAVYLLLGMSLIAMCFSLMQEDAIGKLKKFVTRMGCLRQTDDWDATTSSDPA
ncbi:potassium channel subfamily K member 18-like [Amphibalanus amphitrite]|uniref:potassium channel subfamily K member 18-like n=1 Tax=Amphibalanus amphitrite TaxID=1232801 RepID=UPI001C9019C7|nr:potassium channel subfamily K member 18-like [Amphibalanus amphitrite]